MKRRSPQSARASRHGGLSLSLLLVLILIAIGGCATQGYESTIRRFERMDRQNPPTPGGTLFVGSSTFTRWKQIPTVFAEFDAANRAFGGSVIADQLRDMDRFILPRQPVKIVFYCGDNDINNGDSPETVLENYKTFVERVHEALPTTGIYFVSIKICRARFAMADKVRAANDLIRDFCGTDPRLEFIDINPLILDENGQPIESLYVRDQLHFNADGYARIAPVIRDALRD